MTQAAVDIVPHGLPGHWDLVMARHAPTPDGRMSGSGAEYQVIQAGVLRQERIPDGKGRVGLLSWEHV